MLFWIIVILIIIFIGCCFFYALFGDNQGTYWRSPDQPQTSALYDVNYIPPHIKELRNKYLANDYLNAMIEELIRKLDSELISEQNFLISSMGYNKTGELRIVIFPDHITIRIGFSYDGRYITEYFSNHNIIPFGNNETDKLDVIMGILMDKILEHIRYKFMQSISANTNEKGIISVSINNTPTGVRL